MKTLTFVPGHEITNYGFVIVDNKSMTEPSNYD